MYWAPGRDFFVSSFLFPAGTAVNGRVGHMNPDKATRRDVLMGIAAASLFPGASLGAESSLEAESVVGRDK
jgi:hypothetical protein